MSKEELLSEIESMQQQLADYEERAETWQAKCEEVRRRHVHAEMQAEKANSAYHRLEKEVGRLEQLVQAGKNNLEAEKSKHQAEIREMYNRLWIQTVHTVEWYANYTCAMAGIKRALETGIQERVSGQPDPNKGKEVKRICDELREKKQWDFFVERFTSPCALITQMLNATRVKSETNQSSPQSLVKT
ncbi:hypothetical protein [Noviherbaspirillum malthae]|uniref:hypothetical protein n=1 Tax=Noviherbaspirillum malthae TaxID=1260987 RepID=UPI00188E7573|nr:hypothetical protein [Noviherbaspirillum malthae]